MAVPALPARQYATPQNIVQRQGCPCQLTPVYQEISLPQGDRHHLVNEFAMFQLVHQTKTGAIKNQLSLRNVHHGMHLDELALHQSGASNILLCKVSFDCLIIDQDGNEIRDYITFNLKIPGTGTESEPVFSYDMICQAYGGKKQLYDALKHFYGKGNPAHTKHGHKPSYDFNSSDHDQYIRHTEQLLVAYLALPEASKMLGDRLRAEIRSKCHRAISAKPYNMVLHLHSTKTCCAPCEYNLMGLMNERNGIILNGKILGFFFNFSSFCALPSETLSFSLPKKSLFRLLVTVTAREADADHQKQPTYQVTQVAPKQSTPVYNISVKTDLASSRIFTAKFNSGFDQRKVPTTSSLSDKTIVISGSKATVGSPGTMNKVKAVKRHEIDEAVESMALLKV